MISSVSSKLSSAEVGSLWSSYVGASIEQRFLQYFREAADDQSTRAVIEVALKTTNSIKHKAANFFQQEDLSTPVGYDESDVNLAAPQLFTDNLVLYFIKMMSGQELINHSLYFSNAERKDVRDFLGEAQNQLKETYNQALDILLSKGLYVRSPYITIQNHVEYVKQQSFMAGWFGDRRAVNALEITHLFFNIQRNAVSKAIVTGFSQVVHPSQLRDYFVRGKELLSKHNEILGSILEKSDIPVSISWDTGVTDSTVAPFSEKLMLNQILRLVIMGIGLYGSSMARSGRHDIAAHYSRLLMELQQYADDGFNLAIKNRWLEQPPQPVDREQLVHKK